MISKQILQYKEKFIKPQNYKIDHANHCLVNTLTNEKIDLKITFPFKPALFYNGFTDEYYVYTYATYFKECSILKYERQSIIANIDLCYSAVLFYTIPDLKSIGIIKGNYNYYDNDYASLSGYNRPYANTYFPISNMIIKLKTDGTDNIYYLGNIPIIEAYSKLYLLNPNNKLHITELFNANGTYENIFLIRNLNMPIQNNQKSIALIDLNLNRYMQIINTDKKILYNINV